MRALVLGLIGCSAPLEITAGFVVDPGLDEGEIVAELGMSGPCDVWVETESGRMSAVAAVGPGERTATVLAADSEGLLPPGPARLVAACDGDLRAAELTIVRAALATIDLTGADNVPVAFHKLDLATFGVTPVDMPEVVATPTGVPSPWLDPDAPPWGADVPSGTYNLPAAFLAGGTVEAVATLHDEVVGSDGLVYDADAGLDLRPVLLHATPLPATLGRDDVVLTWQFEAHTPEGTVVLPGTTSTTHEVYRVKDRPFLVDGRDEGFAGPLPWLGVLSDLADPLDEVDVDDAAILDAIRDHITYNDHIRYNPSDGAYGSYEGPYVTWEYQVSELGDWLDRNDGVDLWCHSLACLLSVMGETVGVDATYLVIGTRFRTNRARPAGGDGFTSWGFTAHGIVTPDDGETVWDAAMDFDDPASDGVIQPKGLPLEEYLALLTNDSISIQNRGYCYVE